MSTACQYRYVTDGTKNRNINDVTTILKEINSKFIFQGWFTEYQPLLDECAPLCIINPGYDYKHLINAVSSIKSSLPSVTFCGGIQYEFLYPKTVDPFSKKILSQDDTWEMALDLTKWDIPITRYEVQCLFAKKLKWTKSTCSCTETGCIDYDPKEQMRAFLPDITNKDYYTLLLNLIKKQFDCGVDMIWVDGLFAQADFINGIGILHPEINQERIKEARKQSYNASMQLVTDIHNYGRTIISWDRWIYKELGIPSFDAIMTTPSYTEVSTMTLNDKSWEDRLTEIKSKWPITPVYARIDYGEHSQTPLGALSQVLTITQANQFLHDADQFFKDRDIRFIYPVHGGYMGADVTKLSWGTSRIYDSMAPEFQTYNTIKELSMPEMTPTPTPPPTFPITIESVPSGAVITVD